MSESRDRPDGLRVAVVGGGITGLAAAHRLVELGRDSRSESPTITLFEASSRLGGIIATKKADGRIIECGSDSFITNKPAGVALCRRLGLEDELIPTDPANRRTYVVFRGRLHPVPEGYLLLAPAKVWPIVTSRLFSWRGKLRMALDLVLPRGSDGHDESVAQFVTRRLGREVLERLVQPLVGGIYTGDPRTLSLRATFPRFLEMEAEHRSLILASRRRARSETGEGRGTSGARYSLFVTLKSGLDTLVSRLSQRLPGGAERLNATVERLQPASLGATAGLSGSAAGTVGQANRGTRRASPHPPPPTPHAPWQLELQDGAHESADAVILAVPAPKAAEMVREFDDELAGELARIRYASSAIVNVAYRRADVAHPLDAFGFVVPATEGRSILGCSFSSVKFPVRASKDEVLLRVFVGGALQPELLELDDAGLEALVRKELAELIGARGKPSFIEVARYPDSMPQYEVGHVDRVTKIEQLAARHPGLHLAGNAYHGVGIPDCIASGENAAEAIWRAFDARE